MEFKFPFFSTRKGAASTPMLADDGGLLTAPTGGKWSHLAKQGRVFTGNSAAAGSVLPIYSGTGQVFGLWNPAGSGVNGLIIRVTMTLVDTTGAAGGFVWGVMKNAGSALATGGISAFTEGTPENGLIGLAGGNKIRFTPSAATVIAPTILRHTGINQLVLTPATTGAPGFAMVAEYDGDFILPPNFAIFLAGNIATLSKWAPSVIWAEEYI